MSSLLIPKEQQTAYQRWEMSAFIDDIAEAGASLGTDFATAAKAPIKKPVPTAPLEPHLANYLAKARQEGFNQGQKEGLQVGLNQAKNSLAEQSEVLLKLSHSFSESVKYSNDEISQSLLSLALDIAKAMLKAELAVNSEAVLPIIKEAVKQLPYVTQPAFLILNPVDIEVVKQQLGEELALDGWQFREDASVASGGCLIETGANHIDASNELRWEKISQALGQPNEWQAK